MEKPITFKSARKQIVGMLHMPSRRRGRVPAVVFFHGFTGNKSESHRMFVKLARGLAKCGVASLRVDFFGSGDSEGEFSQMTVSTEVADARAALRFIRRQPGIDPKRVGVVGMSMGGAVASEVLGKDRQIKVAALWAPVADPEEQTKMKMTPEAKTQLREMGCVDYGGHVVGRAFVDDAKKHKPLKSITTTRAPVLVVQGGEDETVPPSAANDYQKVLKKARKPVVKHVIRGANHTFSSLPWETELIGLTLQWLTCNLKG